MRKLRKIFSLVLALVMCLGLTISAFAVESYTENYEGFTITAYSNGSLSYTGTGTLRGRHMEAGFRSLDYAGFIVDGTDYIFGNDTISISVGPGVIITDEFKEFWDNVISGLGVSVTFNDSTAPTQPQQPAGETASPTNDKLEVNGTAANPTVYKINDSNYFKIRDVAALLNGTEKQFAVGYDGEKNAVTATTGQGYDKQSGDLAGAATGGSQTAEPSNDAIYVNGEKITAEVYKINGSNYFKLRDLGKALNFYVGWSADRGMYIETNKPYSE